MEGKNKNYYQRGVLLIYITIIVALFSVLMLPILDIISTKIKILRSATNREQALQIAEAGVNYYQWHLAHFADDYQDGTGQEGPYVHDYVDSTTGQVVGQFSLEITPPLLGSNTAVIESTGWTNMNPSVTRTITVKYGNPSVAQYTILADLAIRASQEQEIHGGKVHSNNGIKWDIGGNAPIHSTKATYICPGWQSNASNDDEDYGEVCPVEKPGIWGAGESIYWQLPVPAVDFTRITRELADLKSQAQNGGIYIPPSNTNGYSLVFNSNGTLSVYKVTGLRSHPMGYNYNVDASIWNVPYYQYTDYDTRVLQYTVALPANGIVFVEDTLWVEGTVNGRATVAAAVLPYSPSTAPIIWIPNNIVYSAKDGSSVLGLIGQTDILTSYYAPYNLEINAAIISQNSWIMSNWYPYGDTGNTIKGTITIYGALMQFGVFWDNFNWHTTSYIVNSIYNFDPNLIYSPPPGFPHSSPDYETLDWVSN